MKRLRLLLGACLILGVSPVLASECGKASVANMNWSSASLIAHIDGFILEHGFGCDVEIVPGDTMPTGTSMAERGQPDIAPEFWTASFKEAFDRGIQEKRLRIASKVLSDGGEEGFWVPDYLVEKDPTLAHIDGVKANAKRFTHPENPGKSAFYGCPAGWNCQISSRNLFEALKLEEAGFEYIDPGSGAALAGSIARAYERNEPWFGYYWAPTGVLGKYSMTKVDFGSGTDEAHYVDCISQADCANPRATMYPPSPVWTVVTEAFAQRAPKAFDYLNTRTYTNTEMNALLAWIEDNQADGETAMVHFMKTYGEKWRRWLPADAAERVAKAVSAL